MQPPVEASRIVWTVFNRMPALHFAPRIWIPLAALAKRQGVPSPQELITRLISDFIRANLEDEVTRSLTFKFEWITYDPDPTKSPEPELVFHQPDAGRAGGTLGMRGNQSAIGSRHSCSGSLKPPSVASASAPFLIRTEAQSSANLPFSSLIRSRPRAEDDVLPSFPARPAGMAADCELSPLMLGLGEPAYAHQDPR